MSNLLNNSSKSFTADKDYYGTDDNKVVGPDHPARRRLIALSGHNVPDPLCIQYGLTGNRKYDEVPVPEKVTYQAKTVESDEAFEERVATAVAKILAEQSTAKPKKGAGTSGSNGSGGSGDSE